ncbi:MAG TPA: discoidin domain-containing protein [Thermoanaerobaculaceae bacterium]|nr:discoidin domain-containing protein [Thermoanaerobaculaceae bacterium]
MNRSAALSRNLAAVAALAATVVVLGYIGRSKKREFAAAVLARQTPAVSGTSWNAGLAEGKSWRSSSGLGDGATSGTITAADGENYFFHTREERNPWLEIDLGASRQLRSVTVVNRLDCCGERAVPLVVEVGTEPDALAQVGRTNHVFKVWTARFTPRLARYVRLHVEGLAYLHLALVGVE